MLPAATAANVAALGEVDQLVVCRSRFYSTLLPLGPDYRRYVIDAIVDGAPMTFSDDPAVSPLAAGPGAPLRALFQGATVDLTTGEVSDVRPWRTTVASTPQQPEGLASDGRNGFRFQLVVDRGLATTVVVQRVEVVYEF
jgi:hypothetical protein